MPETCHIAVERLVPAPWNYKKPGQPEEVKRLAASIQADASAGVLAVRELEDGCFEVIDGNHRLEAIRFLGWKEATCENFGSIDKARAVTIARRRNHQWFEDEMDKLAALYRDDVLPALDADLLDEIMPEGVRGMRALAESLSFDWRDFRPGSDPAFGWNTYRRRLWKAWQALCAARHSETNPGKQFELALLTAIKSIEPAWTEEQMNQDEGPAA
jgi:hypothetical protein